MMVILMTQTHRRYTDAGTKASKKYKTANEKRKKTVRETNYRGK